MRSWPHALGATALVALGLALPVVPRGSVVTDEVPKLADARRQLAHAFECEERLGEVHGRERLRVRLSAIEAFRSVRAFHGRAGDAGARAALEAGAHLATLGFHDEAWREADLAARSARDEGLRLEATLERAHAARRVEDWDRALRDYRWCASRSVGADRVGALLRAGEALAELGRPDAARVVWEDALVAAEPCVATVHVYDRLALECLDRGDAEAAAGWLAECERALRDALARLTPTGTSLRRALVGMRARFELQCLESERASQRRASGDVIDD